MYGQTHISSITSAPLPPPLLPPLPLLAEFWGAIVALQAYWLCHLGIDNLNVVRNIGRLLDADCLAKPLPLVKGWRFGCSCPIYDSYSGS